MKGLFSYSNGLIWDMNELFFFTSIEFMLLVFDIELLISGKIA